MNTDFTGGNGEDGKKGDWSDGVRESWAATLPGSLIFWWSVVNLNGRGER